MIEINIYGEPITVADIRRIRDENSFENSIAFKVMMWTPIPGLDMLAGLATHAVEEHYTGKDLRDRYRAAREDWSGSLITQVYVEKVRLQGRELIGIEVDALHRHLSFERQARAAARVAMELLAEHGIDAAHKTAVAAGEGLAQGIAGFFVGKK